MLERFRYERLENVLDRFKQTKPEKPVKMVCWYYYMGYLELVNQL